MPVDVTSLDTATRGHHPDSPSSLQSSDACPHFTNRNTDSDASKAGVLQHKAAETRNLELLDEPEQVEAVKRCLEIEDGWIKRLTDLGFDVEVVRERYLPVCRDELVKDDKGHEWHGITGGFPDTLIIARDRETHQPVLIVILDWKFGKHLVTPTASNLQGMAYALGALQEWPTAAEVLVKFYHPHVEGSQPRPEYEHVFPRTAADQMELTIRHVIARKGRAKREGWASEVKPRPCAFLCVFCQHLDKAECPAVGQLANIAVSKFESLPVPPELRAAYLTDPAMMKQAYKLTALVEAHAKALRKRITDAVLTEGAEIEGMQIVTKADREVTDIAALKRRALEAGVPEDEFDKLLSIPLTAVEEIIKARAPKRQGAAHVRAFTAVLEEEGITRKGKPYSYLAESKSDDEDATDV